MGALFRSEDMTLLRLYFERGAAHATVDELGKLGIVQFNDLNPEQSAFQRSFSANVRLCDDMQRRIRFLHAQIDHDPNLDVPEMLIPKDVYESRAFALRLDNLDEVLSSHEANLLQMNSHWDTLNVQRNELVELRYVLEKGTTFFQSAPRVQQASYGTVGLLHPSMDANDLYSPIAPSLLDGAPTDRTGLAPSGTTSLLSYFAGVIEKEKVPSFELVLFRATRGNCFVRFAEIPEPLIDPSTGENVVKCAFMVFFSGSEVKSKVSKICNAFSANLYNFPEAFTEQTRAYQECLDRLQDLDTVISTTTEQRRTILSEIAKELPLWDEKVRREKAIYHTLNMLNFDTSNALFIAEVWAPTFSLEDVRTALNAGRQRSQAQVPSILEERPAAKETPPTFFRINRFTSVFQGIVESYGVAEYKEVNPAPFAVVTFPFLFAVMFGDVGHGFLMFAFAAWVVMNEKRMVRRKLGEFMQTCYDGRYMLLLMGAFSIFTGFIYNEFFAVPLNLFGSRWKFTEASAMACGMDNCDIPAEVRAPMHPYPLGFDPVWKGSANGLLFFNSYKMKLSIVLGVCQMVLGICMSYLNAKHFRHPVDVWYVFVPQMIFMNAIFGYLVILIILKWATNWDSPACNADPNCLAPDLKTVLIGMFMSPGNLPEEGRLFPGQNMVQLVLLGAALIAVPWMLFPKPLILKAKHDAKKKDEYRPLVDEGEGNELLQSTAGGMDGAAEAEAEADDHDDEEEFNFANIFVNQMIHTIEFVLGAVSNTASYLRLWALSLAHAELSDVFLEKLLYMSIESGSSILMVVGFFMWIGLTIGVLMFMESLSAFLHALRLHWVEFQNKFYNLHGSGNKFVAFDYEAIREAEE
ncbi:V-type proton ATPase subunit a2 [Gracilariopsis chorda]|uniref:V-type proton ATPase subunit a n=1 Tax=Gracilariopsis chorda TaxID=448386 RepID=A0A2V3IQL2_9FLOR|nr:V-type proton ATPase subunit a2 [Gracilariopsis chorda]|eukprot:PXF44378.1 V-type proton ATPase subunit a2 [Gracilariopsis chorda]